MAVVRAFPEARAGPAGSLLQDIAQGWHRPATEASRGGRDVMCPFDALSHVFLEAPSAAE